MGYEHTSPILPLLLGLSLAQAIHRFYIGLAERPGVARGKKRQFSIKKEKNTNFFLSITPPGQKKISAQSLQPFGRIYATYL